jgi:hypothetical protein
MAVFCDVAPFNLIEINRRFRGNYFFYRQRDGGGDKLPLTVGQFLPDYTVHPRRQLALLSKT